MHKPLLAEELPKMVHYIWLCNPTYYHVKDAMAFIALIGPTICREFFSELLKGEDMSL
jgi:hypothetical protein